MYHDQQTMKDPSGAIAATMAANRHIRATEAPQPKSEVAAELDRLALIIEQTEKAVVVLGERLRPVRRPTGLNGDGQTSAPEPVLCDVASAIRSRRQTLEHVLGGLHQAINELEI
jgi:hypothetical protein